LSPRFGEISMTQKISSRVVSPVGFTAKNNQEDGT